jgi:TonB-dependent SusC/RagA subfamily outer membrane receptor
LKEELTSIYPTNPQLIKRPVGIWVVDNHVCPSVLVECGYITNQRDREFITNEANQKLVAEKILSAVERYAASSQLSTLTGSLTQENGKEIRSIHTNTYAGRVTIIYVDDTSETITVEEAEQRKLINKTTDSDRKTALPKAGVDKPLQTSHDKDKPIYFVDGKEYKGDLNKLAPNKIESVNVLKDQTAVSKYGEKGRNGVIEIVTKPGNRQDIFDTIPKATPVFKKPEVEASVDKKEWREFLEKNLQTVIENVAKKGAATGTYTVNLRFLVKKDGSISGLKALNDPGYGIVQKVLEIMPNSPKWNPGYQNGKKVNSYHTQPITFVISD